MRAPWRGRGSVKTLLLTLIIGLSLVPLVGCGGEPSPLDVAAKADVVVPRTQELMLTASFSPETECRELAGEFAEEYAVDKMPYADADPKDRMSKLENLEKGLDDFEEDLEKADCLP